MSAWLIDWCLTSSLAEGWADCYIEKREMDKVGRFCLATGNQRTLLPKHTHHELKQLFVFVQRDRHLTFFWRDTLSVIENSDLSKKRVHITSIHCFKIFSLFFLNISIKLFFFWRDTLSVIENSDLSKKWVHIHLYVDQDNSTFFIDGRQKRTFVSNIEIKQGATVDLNITLGGKLDTSI